MPSLENLWTNWISVCAGMTMALTLAAPAKANSCIRYDEQTTLHGTITIAALCPNHAPECVGAYPRLVMQLADSVCLAVDHMPEYPKQIELDYAGHNPNQNYVKDYKETFLDKPMLVSGKLSPVKPSSQWSTYYVLEVSVITPDITNAQP